MQHFFNVDGGALTNRENMSYGGLIRKHYDSFQLDFFGRVGISNILHTEISSLESSCVGRRTIENLCYYDSLHVVQLVMKETLRFHHHANLLELNRDYLAKE